eukprot:s831_g7.t1
MGRTPAVEYTSQQSKQDDRPRPIVIVIVLKPILKVLDLGPVKGKSRERHQELCRVINRATSLKFREVRMPRIRGGSNQVFPAPLKSNMAAC